jgi:hypothetical protein
LRGEKIENMTTWILLHMIIPYGVSIVHRHVLVAQRLALCPDESPCLFCTDELALPDYETEGMANTDHLSGVLRRPGTLQSD